MIFGDGGMEIAGPAFAQPDIQVSIDRIPGEVEIQGKQGAGEVEGVDTEKEIAVLDVSDQCCPLCSRLTEVFVRATLETCLK